jgi:hypothetical protein
MIIYVFKEYSLRVSEKLGYTKTHINRKGLVYYPSGTSEIHW